MTLGTVLLVLVFVVILFMMMKKGGGCCGGGNVDQEPLKGGGCCGGSDPQEPHAHHDELESGDSDADIDPVCGMVAESSSIVSEHQSKSYYFCSENCRKTFDSSPEKFVS